MMTHMYTIVSGATRIATVESHLKGGIRAYERRLYKNSKRMSPVRLGVPNYLHWLKGTP